MSRIGVERTLQVVVGGTVDESDVWSRARAGDGRALSDLFERHVDRVFRHVVALVPSSADADEVASAAFFELWRRRDHVRLVNGSVLPWLLVTATNLARNSSRSTRRYGALLSRLPRSPDLIADDSEEHAVEAERRRALVAGLQRLSTTDAALVVLTALEGLPVPDAAGQLGLSLAAARARLLRARRSLRALLSNDIRLDINSGGAPT